MRLKNWKWVIYFDKSTSNRYRMRRGYLRFDSLDGVQSYIESFKPRSATVYDSKKEAESAALMFALRNPEFIGKLRITRTKR